MGCQRRYEGTGENKMILDQIGLVSHAIPCQAEPGTAWHRCALRRPATPGCVGFDQGTRFQPYDAYEYVAWSCLNKRTGQAA